MTSTDTSTSTSSATLRAMRDGIITDLISWPCDPSQLPKLQAIVHIVAGNGTEEPERMRQRTFKGRKPNELRRMMDLTLRAATAHNGRLTDEEILAELDAQKCTELLRTPAANLKKIRDTLVKNSAYYKKHEDGTWSLKR